MPPHIFGAELQTQCPCGKAYWPSQKWIHAKCLVVNTAANVVVNSRTRDRHKKTEKRREYVKLKMREHRANLTKRSV